MNDILEIVPNTLVTADGQSVAVDVSAFHGRGQLILAGSEMTGTNPLLGVELQHSADGATGWDAVVGVEFADLDDEGAVTQVVELDIDGLRKFVRAGFDISGTDTPTGAVAMTLVGRRKYG